MSDIDRSRLALEYAVKNADDEDVETSWNEAQVLKSSYGWDVTYEEFLDILRWELLDRRGECPT